MFPSVERRGNRADKLLLGLEHLLSDTDQHTRRTAAKRKSATSSYPQSPAKPSEVQHALSSRRIAHLLTRNQNIRLPWFQHRSSVFTDFEPIDDDACLCLETAGKPNNHPTNACF